MCIRASCLSGCPCGLDCPNGCEGCSHPLCTLSPCEDLDNNADYQRCKKQYTKELNECIDACRNSLLCIDECTDEFKKNLFDLGFLSVPFIFNCENKKLCFKIENVNNYHEILHQTVLASEDAHRAARSAQTTTASHKLSLFFINMERIL